MLTTQLIKQFEAGQHDKRLQEIYIDETLIPYQRKRYIDLLNEHLARFGDRDVILLSVPGRSELMGNHTDHQRGRVLACSLNLDIICAVCAGDEMVLYSNGQPINNVDINQLNVQQSHTSRDLVRGVIHAFKTNGYNYGNALAVMRSDVLVGSGLSSSAAFEVMIGNIMNYLFNEGKVPQIEIAKFSQYAENVYFGKPCGLMDQCACALGGIVYIDFNDPRSPEVEKINTSLAEHGYSLCIVNTGGSHSNLTGEYAAITSEMKNIATYFGCSVLRNVNKEDIIKRISELRKMFGDRAVMRALHMKNEDERVVRQPDNLHKGNFEAFLKDVQESGNSSFRFLQNVYASRKPNEQPISLAIMLSEMLLEGGKGVCRVHGGGFAGTMQAFVKTEYVEEYREGIEKVFGAGSCLILQVNNEGATRVL